MLVLKSVVFVLVGLHLNFLKAALVANHPVQDDQLHKHLLISPSYSSHHAPSLIKGRPLPVEFSINVRNVLGINEKEQLISLETSLRMFWIDPRVKVRDESLNLSAPANEQYITFNPKVAHHFWIPDIFLDRAKDIRVPTYFTRPASLRIYRDSTFRYSSRINFDAACPMDFHRYPVDSQLCEINFESFGHTNKQLTFSWKANASNVNPNITLAQFDMEVVLEETYATDYYDLAYPGIIMKIHLTREIGYHIVQTYIPSVIFVILAWLSMFISPDSVPGRVGMGMTTLLTVTAMFGSVRQNVPRVSYVSYLDIWMLMCILFVFFCVLEFTVVTTLLRGNRRYTVKTLEYSSRLPALQSIGDGNPTSPQMDASTFQLVDFEPGYNVHEHPPTQTGEALQVDFQINLRNVLQVDEVAQICSLEMTIRMYWTDLRIKKKKVTTELDFVTLNPRAAQYFWIPDIFIDQAKDLRVPSYYVRPASIRVYNDSRIRFAARVNFDVACGMEFHRYPHDVQTCEVKFESFGYTNRQMRYAWLSGNNINQNISLPQFDLEVKLGNNYSTDYYDLAYPGVIMRILLSRKMSFHLMQTYIPSFIFVTLAWLTIFIPPDQIPARHVVIAFKRVCVYVSPPSPPGRVTMTMTTLLTLTAMFAAVRSNVPRVSYVSFLDIWMFVCIVFVFLVIIHFIIVIMLLRLDRVKSANALEKLGAILIPVAFFSFNLLYWAILYGGEWL
ncbi:hypothetical protein TCAL_05021, partial [Tigriopus californicus]|eukprot:TCALIF_05021-PA protein Name:"Similar to Glra4 Glycine receptor subunit alpha-4 (Mus musculus)" AED:0.09 eAED:0.09 QI:319/0.66/0.42/1/0.83/0.71/7/0/727